MKTAMQWSAFKLDLTLQIRPGQYSSTTAFFCLIFIANYLSPPLPRHLPSSKFSFACVENSSALIWHLGGHNIFSRHNMIHHGWWWSYILSYLGIPCRKLSHTKSDSNVSTIFDYNLSTLRFSSNSHKLCSSSPPPLTSDFFLNLLWNSTSLSALDHNHCVEHDHQGFFELSRMPGPLSHCPRGVNHLQRHGIQSQWDM